MLKFSTSVLSGEAPVYDGDSLIAFTFQRRDPKGIKPAYRASPRRFRVDRAGHVEGYALVPIHRPPDSPSSMKPHHIEALTRA